MTKFRWLISGVGRSGTTMTYGALLATARAADMETLGRYEPFLWGPPTWDKLPGDMGEAFFSTSSMNSRGLFAHTESPLFVEESHPVLDRFIDETMPRDCSVVSKMIRGAGRLSAFLERDSDLKIIHLIRNPLDVVNSALLHFSFFGSEFHPSDEARFNSEAEKNFGSLYRPSFELTETGRSLEWWRLMNEAALKSAERFPERIKIIPYETLMLDLPSSMSEIVNFLGGPSDLIDNEGLKTKVGPVTSWKSLRATDRDMILPYVDAYFDDSRIFGSNPKNLTITALKSGVLDKYAECSNGPAFKRAIEPDLTPTQVRMTAARSQQDMHTSRIAGKKQVEQIVEKVVADLSKEQAKGIAALATELNEKKADLRSKEMYIAKLKAGLSEAERDRQASSQLTSRLRDRVTSMRNEQASQQAAFEKLRIDKRNTGDKLRKTENRLQAVTGEGKRYQQQLTELTSVLAPRLTTILTLRPLRYILRQRKRVKFGTAHVDKNGFAQPK